MHSTNGVSVNPTSAPASSTTPASAAPGGATNKPQPMKVTPYFCPVDVDPFETTEWEKRTAAIKDENGKVLFEQTDCEIPKDWSPLATNVVVSKYFYGEHKTAEREKSVRQVIHRVARTIADWGIQDGYFATRQDGENFYRELAWLCLHQHGGVQQPGVVQRRSLPSVRREGLAGELSL